MNEKSQVPGVVGRMLQLYKEISDKALENEKAKKDYGPGSPPVQFNFARMNAATPGVKTEISSGLVLTMFSGDQTMADNKRRQSVHPMP